MSEAASQWVSVASAAQVCQVSERTVWRWVRDGIVESRQEKRGQQSTRIINRESLPEEPLQSVSEAVRPPASEAGRTRPDMTEGDGASQRLNAPSHAVECQCCKVREEQVSHLHAQLEVRVREIEQERTAGEQLRVMLMKLESTNAELAGALVQKALPPHEDTQAPAPKRVRWWFFGRR